MKIKLKSIGVIIAALAAIFLIGVGIGYVTFRMDKYGEFLVFVWVASWYIAIVRYHREIWSKLNDYFQNFN